MDAVIRKEFMLDGLCCPVCAGKIESGVRELEGVGGATLDFASQRLVIDITGAADVEGVVRRAGGLVSRVEPGIAMRERAGTASASRTLFLHGLHCADCAAKIQRRVAGLEGVSSVVVDVVSQKMILEAEDREQLPVLLREAGAITREVEPDITVSLSPGEDIAAAGDRKRRVQRAGLLVGAALFVVGLAAGLSGPVRLLVFLASYLLVGGEVVWRAVKNIARGQVFDENFLMSVATIGAFAIGEYPEGVAVMLFYQVGEAFQRLAVNRSRRSITALMDIRPDFANLQTADGELRRVSPEEVAVGERIAVRPGEKVPLDGVVAQGFSALDTSALTGESLPREVAPGDEILSGSINKSGLLVVEVTRAFGESTVSKILDLVQNATTNKAPMENFITKFARYYTPAVVFAALALAVMPPLLIPGALWAEWIRRALVFLVVSCPCALVISIPLSYFGGIGGASRRGILVKGSNFLEALNRVDTVVFDKTGTLTRGVFRVAEIQPRGGYDADTLLRLAAQAESGSNHPIAESIQRAYEQPVDPAGLSDYQELAGLGLRVRLAEGTVLAGNARLMEQEGIVPERPDTVGTAVHLAVDGAYAGYLVIEDEVKADSAQAVQSLRELGVRRTVMLTGDARAVGERIGAQLGLDEVRAELLPQQKVEALESLEQGKQGNGALVFVGDGINDAPVLARSDIGVAMGGLGSDAAIEAADVVLMTDEPSKLADGIRIARKTRRIVWQNVMFALGVKAVILVLGALGIATMWEAVFGDVGVAVIATLNAMRAMRTV